MKALKQGWVPVLVLGLLALGIAIARSGDDARQDPARSVREHHSHQDHSVYFDEPIATGREATQACLECHAEAAEEMRNSPHFQLAGDTVTDPASGESLRIGKRNLINNFCIAIGGNWASCTRCHAGYGYDGDDFDFDDVLNVDCLVCHDRSGAYRKGSAGRPREEVDLQAVAKSVGYPTRENCGTCHFYGGGGLGVKHGDLDNSLQNPDPDVDVHMGRGNLLCIDCHGGHGHDIRGKSYSVSVNHENGIGCTDCHGEKPHADERLDTHAEKIACQTCHIPTYATRVPTKMWWDWSKAGDDHRPDDTHTYLKIKGEFDYEREIVPEYYWFDLTVDRYLVGDPAPASGPIEINHPNGSRADGRAKIWPFKVHRGKQPVDAESGVLIPPITSGEGGYWKNFDWGEAIRLGAEQAGLEYSGSYDFGETEMYWPLSHMVRPKDKALACADCHGADTRLDWEALGYPQDPERFLAGNANSNRGGGAE